METKETQEGIKPVRVFGKDVILTNPSDIEYYRVYMREYINFNRLVGTFDDDGVYYIPEEINRELAAVDKEIEENSESFIKALTLFDNKLFKFDVQIEKLENGEGCASLYLTENIDNGVSTSFLHTFVAKIIDEFDENFVVKVKKVFHLLDDTPTIIETSMPRIALLMQEQADDRLFLDELIELSSQIFVLRMLELLENAGEEGKEILQAYKERVQEYEDQSLKKANEWTEDERAKAIESRKYTQLRKILDDVVFEKGGYEKLSIEPAKIQENQQSFVEPIKKVEKLKEQYVVKETMQKKVTTPSSSTQTVEKKPPAKTSSAKKEVKKPSTKPTKKAGKEKEKKDEKKEEKKKISSGFSLKDSEMKKFSSKDAKEKTKSLIEEMNVVADESTKKKGEFGVEIQLEEFNTSTNDETEQEAER